MFPFISWNEPLIIFITPSIPIYKKKKKKYYKSQKAMKHIQGFNANFVF